MFLRATLTCLILILSIVSEAQEAIKARPSPLAIVSARYKNSYLKITYSQPHKKGREIFGKLVPYGEIWRTGANEATELTISNDVTINNQLIKAGTYSLFTIPGKENWTIILNSELGLWGSYNYNSKLDLLRFDTPVQSLNNVLYEPFTIMIDQKLEKAEVSLLWDRSKISFTIQFQEPK